MHHDTKLKPRVAHTEAVRRVLGQQSLDHGEADDLFFLEDWEAQPVLSFAALLRVRQIQLAQPALAAEVRAEVVARRQANSGRAGNPVARPLQPALSSLLRPRS